MAMIITLFIIRRRKNDKNLGRIVEDLDANQSDVDLLMFDPQNIQREMIAGEIGPLGIIM